MGFCRFHRSIRLLPDVRINLGKRSASMSVGVRGVHVTFGGPQGTRTTVGLPGTGLSYPEVSKPAQAAHDEPQGPVQHASAARGLLWFGLLVLIVGVMMWLTLAP